ncbi:hypothetical protein N9845_02830 [Akkermansiaceae bacterium]|nr:hypothetical protein [Akkermansiaceae bacterium]
MNEAPGDDLAVDLGVGLANLDFLVGHHCIAVGRERGPGHDLPAGPSGEFGGLGVACGMEAVEAEFIEVTFKKGDAIHRDAVEGREGAVRENGLPENPAERALQRHPFVRKRSDGRKDESLGFGWRDEHHVTKMHWLLRIEKVASYT